MRVRSGGWGQVGGGGDGSPFWVCYEWRGRGLERGVACKVWGHEGGVTWVGKVEGEGVGGRWVCILGM